MTSAGAGRSLMYRALLAFGRAFRPLTQDPDATVAQALGVLVIGQRDADEIWRALSPIERRDLRAWADRRRGWSPESRAVEATEDACSRG